MANAKARELPPIPPADRGLLTVAMAAQYLSISEASCRRLIDAGKLASVKLGDTRRVTRGGLEQFASHLEQVGHIAITGADDAAS